MNYEKLDSIVMSMKDELIADLKQWIAVPSVLAPATAENAPFGAENRRMLDLALETARKYGFETRDIDGYAGDVTLSTGEQTLGMLCHLDVVPAGDGWQHDPWGGEIEDNKMYGRGTNDDKGPALCALYAMRAVKAAGIPLKDGVRLILGCDEETGMRDMRHYAEKMPMPDYGFSPDAEFPVINIEKGGLGLQLCAYTGGEGEGNLTVQSLYAGERANVVPGLARAEMTVNNVPEFKARVAQLNEEKQFHLTVEENNGKVTLVAEGKGAHASTPQNGLNAAGMLLIALKELGAGGGSKDAIAALADKVGLEYDGASLGIRQSDEESGPLTCNLGILRYDGTQLTAQLDIRYPICADEKDMCGCAAMAISGTCLSVRRTGGHPPLHVPKDSKIVSGLLEVYHDVTGLDAYTIAIGGGTYSRCMPNTVAFGMLFPGELELAHMPDEYIDLDKMMLTVKIFAHAIAKLAGADA